MSEKTKKVISTYELLQRQKADILRIAQRCRAENLRLFGSAARGDDHDSSDIDLLVDFLPGSTLIDQITLIDELTEKLGRKVDVISSRALNKHLRETVLSEAKEL